MSAAVPVLVSRAVELFLAEMVRLSLEAKEGSRHISPSHVRHCIDHNEQFDFLRPLVEHIPTEISDATTRTRIGAKAAATKRKKSASDEFAGESSDHESAESPKRSSPAKRIAVLDEEPEEMAQSIIQPVFNSQPTLTAPTATTDEDYDD